MVRMHINGLDVEMCRVCCMITTCIGKWLKDFKVSSLPQKEVYHLQMPLCRLPCVTHRLLSLLVGFEMSMQEVCL